MQLPAIEQTVMAAGHTVLTPLVSLDTPGKATVQVVILADPVSHAHVVRRKILMLCALVGYTIFRLWAKQYLNLVTKIRTIGIVWEQFQLIK